MSKDWDETKAVKAGIRLALSLIGMAECFNKRGRDDFIRGVSTVVTGRLEMWGVKREGPASRAQMWQAIDVLYPEHDLVTIISAECNDERVGGARDGCRRCQAIMHMQGGGVKLWPRSDEAGPEPIYDPGPMLPPCSKCGGPADETRVFDTHCLNPQCELYSISMEKLKWNALRRRCTCGGGECRWCHMDEMDRSLRANPEYRFCNCGLDCCAECNYYKSIGKFVPREG